MSKETKFKPIEQGKSNPSPAESENALVRRGLERVLFGLFVVAWLIAGARRVAPGAWFGASGWPEHLLWSLALVAVLCSLVGQLHWQNLLSASVIIGLASGIYRLAQMAVSARGWVFPKCDFLAWVLEWIVAVFTARGVAEILLTQLKSSSRYGLWLLALATMLIGFFGWASQPNVPNSEPTPGHLAASWQIPILWGTVGFFMQALATPWLIKERSIPKSPNYLLLIVWFLLHSLFALETLSKQWWNSLIIIVVGNGVIAVVIARKLRSSAS